MSIRESQADFTVRQLKHKGYITRNQALSNNITRLGAIIFNLKNKKNLLISGFFGKVKKNNTIEKTINQCSEKNVDFIYVLHTSQTECEELKITTEKRD